MSVRGLCLSLGILLVQPKAAVRVMYIVDMPNVCLKKKTCKRTVYLSFSRPHMPDSRIDHLSSAPASTWLEAPSFCRIS
jgi:hypothetical protein